MNENNLILNIMDLINAIQNDDLELTKEKVEYINTNIVDIQSIGSLHDFIPFFELSFLYDNKSYRYSLTNLKSLSNVEQLLWKLEIKDLINTNNKNKINDFISTFLQNNSIIQNYQFASLIQMATIADNQILLQEIRERIKNS